MAHLLTPPFSVGHQIGIASNVAAIAGEVGEVITATLARSSAISLTTTVAVNVTSISLTPGDWTLYGVLGHVGSSPSADLRGGFNSVSAVLPGLDAGLGIIVPAQNLTVIDHVISLPTSALFLNSTTTLYLVSLANFASGTVTTYGTITARRMR